MLPEFTTLLIIGVCIAGYTVGWNTSSPMVRLYKNISSWVWIKQTIMNIVNKGDKANAT